MEDASLALPARQETLRLTDVDASGAPVSATPLKNQKAKSEKGLTLPPTLPLMLNARDLAPPGDLRFVDVPAKAAPEKPLLKKEPLTRGGAVLRGLKDLQQLQKQTIAVLEAVKGTLDDIAQALRSPEATRGMEKQQNAATLLAKGFAQEAIEQAQGAAGLLPANPEAHLLLSLSLAADQQFDQALAAARKGLALFDRRTHPLAIEAGLLHALAALGCGAEAVDRWTAIIDGLPLPILFEHLGRIASCFPSEVTGGGAAMLDELVNRRLARDDQNPVAFDPGHRRRTGTIHIRPDEIPAPTLFVGLDAAHDFKLPYAHRAVLGLIARRLQLVRQGMTPAPGSAGTDAAEGGTGGAVIKFLTECVIPLGNRGLEQTADALGRAALRRLLRLQADVMTLHRALGKLEMAGAATAQRELRGMLAHWRQTSNTIARKTAVLWLALLLMIAGVGGLAYVLWGLGAITGQVPLATVGPWSFAAIWIGPGIMGGGAFLGLLMMLTRTWTLDLPAGRQPLTRGERAYLNSAAVKPTLR